MSEKSSRLAAIKPILYALGANGGIAVAKFVAAFFTGSGAMLAEAIHSLADCINQVFLLIGVREAARPADDAHPMGYARAVYFWAMIVGLLLFFVGGAFSVMQGIAHFRHPEPLGKPWLAIGILLFSMVLESFSLAGAIRHIRPQLQHTSFVRWFRETRESEMVVVTGEDIAALLGLVLALAGIVLATVTGNPVWDACATIAVGVLLMGVALAVTREIKAMVIGESVASAMRLAIADRLASHALVERVLNMIALQWGDHVMLAVRVVMKPQPSGTDLVAAINQVESALQQEWPALRWIFFEPESQSAAIPANPYAAEIYTDEQPANNYCGE